MDNSTGLIYSAMPKIAKAIGAIPKSQKNATQGFNFRGIDQFLNAAHDALCDHGVVVLPEVLDQSQSERPAKSGGVLISTYLTMRFTFTASDGSSVSCSTRGEGMDSGDKSTNKAMSAAMKYALALTFSVPTSDVVDGDADSPEPAHRTAPKPAPAPRVDDSGNEPDPGDTLTWDKQIAAKFDNSKCALCGKKHVSQGEQIVNVDGVGWSALACAQKHNAARSAEPPPEDEEGLPF